MKAHSEKGDKGGKRQAPAKEEKHWDMPDPEKPMNEAQEREQPNDAIIRHKITPDNQNLPQSDYTASE